jgi:hypothetical protein
MGFGKYRPIETNDTDEGRKRNRRGEIILRAPDSPKPQKTEILDPIRGNAPIVKNPVFQQKLPPCRCDIRGEGIDPPLYV